MILIENISGFGNSNATFLSLFRLEVLRPSQLMTLLISLSASSTIIGRLLFYLAIIGESSRPWWRKYVKGERLRLLGDEPIIPNLKVLLRSLIRSLRDAFKLRVQILVSSRG